MDALLTKVHRVHVECVGQEAAARKRAKPGTQDEFERLRGTVAADLKRIRQTLAEREQLLGKANARAEVVAKNAQARRELNHVRGECERLRTLQEKLERKHEKHNKDGGTDEQRELLDRRRQVVDLAARHADECEKVLRERDAESAQKATEEPRRISLFRGGGKGKGKDGGGGGGGSGGGGGGDGKDELQPMSDVDVDAGFAQQDKNEARIQRELDEIGAGVTELRQIAQGMSSELDKQDVIIQETQEQLEEADEKLRDLNRKLRKSLNKIRKGDRFIMDFILLMVVLGIAMMVYKMVG